ncbi:MAG: HAMP domain-containing histidine kinase [Bdellovibrionales bacterium]|nr:HAMP domain-containing histidine kinase [Bdellovibrionales bacterium]
MRNRFFFIILTTLILSAVGITFVHAKFFKSQRLKLIDRQLTESSTVLLASEEFRQAAERLERVEDAISLALQGTRIGKVFVLRDAQGKIVYQSFNVSLLQAELPTHPEWVAVETPNEYVRVRNLKLGDNTLQVGLVLDRYFLDWEILDQRLVNYVAAIVICLFLASVLLTVVLLSPLRLLIKHLSDATSNLTNLRDVKSLPSQLKAYAQGFWATSDEFARLLETVQKLIDRINRNYKLTRSWTLQMAHELKTPLAIIRSETEEKASAGQIPDAYAQDVINEVDQMTHIVTEFLDWAELENSVVQRDLHALRIRPVLEAVTGRLQKIYSGRLRLTINDDFAIFANPIHLDQMLTNILTNALKFSPPQESVQVDVTGHTLRVRDAGRGFPEGVLERLGQPFNVGPASEGHTPGNGLGLAWVSAVSKVYQWRLEIENVSGGADVRIHFPHEIAT